MSVKGMIQVFDCMVSDGLRGLVHQQRDLSPIAGVPERQDLFVRVEGLAVGEFRSFHRSVQFVGVQPGNEAFECGGIFCIKLDATALALSAKLYLPVAC